MDRGAWLITAHGGQKESDQTDQLHTHSLMEDLAGSGSGASLEARP